MISLFFFLISSLGCVLTANMIKSHPKDVIDIIHHNVPYISLTYLSDALVLAQTALTATVVDSKSLAEIFLIMGVVQIFRCFCSASTVLPPLKNYSDKYRLGGLNGTGTEYIFSGHASYSALGAIYLYKEGIISLFPLILYNLISQLAIIITRNHYTVDIVLAWIIVPLVWGNMYFCTRDAQCLPYIKFLL
jgi:hypothetical protein